MVHWKFSKPSQHTVQQEDEPKYTMFQIVVMVIGVIGLWCYFPMIACIVTLWFLPMPSWLKVVVFLCYASLKTGDQAPPT
jgi:hypothetical protein